MCCGQVECCPARVAGGVDVAAGELVGEEEVYAVERAGTSGVV